MTFAETAPDIRSALLSWFDAHARELPWRGSDDPYAVLVSEIMSQQTRIDTVRDYWTRWMATYPTIGSLAAADVDDVMKLWAGLGYYRRARNLHACAALVAADRGGRLPETVAELLELPGVGPYTAAAVASMVHGEVAPAIDGNLSRVLARLAAVDGDPTRAAFKKQVSDLATLLIDETRPGAWNEAMMDLGARICTPRNPSCDVCPIASWCVARAAGEQTEYPRPKKRKAPRRQSRQSIVAIRGDEVFMRRGADALLGGLWEFPTYEAPLSDALELAFAQHGLRGDPEVVGEVEHLFSHIRMTYHVVTFEHVGDARDGRWVALSALDDEGVSTAMRRVADVASDRQKN